MREAGLPALWVPKNDGYFRESELAGFEIEDFERVEGVTAAERHGLLAGSSACMGPDYCGAFFPTCKCIRTRSGSILASCPQEGRGLARR
jgi:hypothetical protein